MPKYLTFTDLTKLVLYFLRALISALTRALFSVDAITLIITLQCLLLSNSIITS